jgi:carbonic anhydrase
LRTVRLNQETLSTITPAFALERLMEGNRRFVASLKEHHDLLEQVNETIDGQWPFAVVLSCIDSRTSAELIFDQGLGDIFSIRIAGNIVNDDILGSMEYACKIVGSKMIVVLGHTRCGAIQGACDHIEMGHLTGLIQKIKPAIGMETTETTKRDSSNHVFMYKVAMLNVRNSMQQVLDNSPIIKAMVEAGTIGIAGGMYEVETGNVTFSKEDIIINPPAHS